MNEPEEKKEDEKDIPPALGVNVEDTVQTTDKAG